MAYKLQREIQAIASNTKQLVSNVSVLLMAVNTDGEII